MTLSELKEAFYYDETSPTFLRWNKDIWSGSHGKTLSVPRGTVAGWLNSQGYSEVKCNGVCLKCHRIIYSLCHNVELTNQTR